MNKSKFFIKESSNHYLSLKIADGQTEPEWLKKADFENAVVEIDENGDVIWRGGAWLGGTWVDGTWIHGDFVRGTWKNGKWLSGNWLNGIWEGGIWKKGNWVNGTWLRGILNYAMIKDPETGERKHVYSSEEMKYYYGE